MGPVLELVEQLDPSQRVLALRTARENQWFDRKSAKISARSLADTLVGFANAEGGLVVVGLSASEPEDACADGAAVNSWRQAGIDYAQPPVRTEVRELEWVEGERSGRFLLVNVQPSETVHQNSKDEVLLRVGDENRRLSFHQRGELIFDKGQAQYDGTTPHAWPADLLDWASVEQYAAGLGARDINKLLGARHLVDRRGQVTVAGMLMFGQAPATWFPSAHLRVIRYRGIERGSGSRLQVMADYRFEGRIPDQVARASDVIHELVPNRQALRADGRFGAVPLIPRDAWLEGLVNAAVHRSYSNFGDHTRIEVFDDRIEIESPGRFPGLADPKKPLELTRFARNPHIARVAAELGLGREFGEGIPRMFDEMRLAGLADPRYHQTSGSVRLVLPTDPVERELEAQLPPETREIARLLRDAGRLGTGDIVIATGRSRPWVLSQLRRLEDSRVAQRVGKSPKDPRAYWRLRVD